MLLDEKIEKFIVKTEQRTLCQPCLKLVFLAPKVVDNLDLTAPYEAFVRHFDAQLMWERNDCDRMHARKIPTQNRERWHDQVKAELSNITEGATIEIRSESHKDEWRMPFFEFHSVRVPDARLLLHMALPLSWIEEVGLAGLETFIDDILAKGSFFTFGYVSLGIMWDRSSVTDPAVLRPLFYQWLKQHPGLASPSPTAQIYPAHHGLADIGWITMLGKEYAEKAGGAEEILNRIDEAYRPDVHIRSLADGALAIRAGDCPQFGNVAADNLLETQRAVGRALRVLWNEEKNKVQVVEGFPNSGNDLSERGAWANRFFV